jgi:hypothetical protein
MEKSVLISTKLSASGDYISIPVRYSINEEDGNENIKLIDCTVDLSPDEIPEWLSPAVFTIRQVYNPGYTGVAGVTVTELSRIPCKNVNSANFVDNTHEHIRLKENLA